MILMTLTLKILNWIETKENIKPPPSQIQHVYHDNTELFVSQI